MSEGPGQPAGGGDGGGDGGADLVWGAERLRLLPERAVWLERHRSLLAQWKAATEEAKYPLTLERPLVRRRVNN